MSDGIHRVVVRYGFMDETNVPRALANASEAELGFFYEPMRISYFLSRETIITSDRPGMDPLRQTLFAWMSRSASSAMEFFSLPVNRVIELGDQIEI
jgi:KUP system potassium uptake protein